MGDVVNMSGAEKSGRGPNSLGGAVDNATSRAKFSYRLFLIVNLVAYEMIEMLRVNLEAHSYGDVIRQAVRAYAIHFVEDEQAARALCQQIDDSIDGTSLKRINIRVPVQTKERLDALKERSGLLYTDVILCGLKLLSARAKKEERLLSSLETVSQKGGGRCMSHGGP